MKKYLFLSLMLLTTCITFAQIDYRSLLVRGNQTFWATEVSLYDTVGGIVQYGIRLDEDGFFDKYSLTTENDTISPYDYLDTEAWVLRRTFKLHDDTLFVVRWYKNIDSDGMHEFINQAYKILYITEKQMITLALRKNKKGEWIEDTYPPHHMLRTLVFRYMNHK